MLRTQLSKSAARLGRQARWNIGARNLSATTRRRADVQLTIDGKQVSIEGKVKCSWWGSKRGVDQWYSGLRTDTGV